MAQSRLPECLEDARIQLPASAFYVPNFITAEEEAYLLEKIRSAPITRWTNLSKRRLQAYPSRLGAKNTLLAEQLPAWLVDPVVTRLRAIPVASPRSAERPTAAAAAAALEGEESCSHIFAASPHGGPNHVLINEYEPGQGIMPHEDGAAYWPVVATVSLGSATVFDIYEKSPHGGGVEKHPKWRVLQEARSILITAETLYTDYLHGVAETTIDEDLGPETIANWNQLGAKADFEETGINKRQTRISLTYRDVRRVLRLSNRR